MNPQDKAVSYVYYHLGDWTRRWLPPERDEQDRVVIGDEIVSLVIDYEGDTWYRDGSEFDDLRLPLWSPWPKAYLQSVRNRAYAARRAYRWGRAVKILTEAGRAILDRLPTILRP